MTESINKKYPTFCILPFGHISTLNDGSYRICCHSMSTIKKTKDMSFNVRSDSIEQVWNSEFYIDIRNKMVKGERPASCEYCWKLEDQGVFSPRQKNNNNSETMYENVQNIIDDSILNDGYLSTYPIDLDIKIGALCNLKCIMCYPGSSSLHVEEADQWKKEGITVPKAIKLWDIHVKEINLNLDEFAKREINIDAIIENLKPSLSTAKYLSIVGGEPLINPVTPKLLDTCAEQGYTNMHVSIITNLSALNRRVIENLNKFKSVTLHVSYDHIDAEKFNFIRFPADYVTFLENFFKLFEYKNIIKKLSTTWGIFNIFDFEAIFDEWERISNQFDYDIHIQVTWIKDPDYFSIKYLSSEQKIDLINRVEKYLEKNKSYRIFKNNPTTVAQLNSIKNFIEETPKDFDEVLTERTRVLSLYDKTRNTNYLKLFPYLKS